MDNNKLMSPVDFLWLKRKINYYTIFLPSLEINGKGNSAYVKEKKNRISKLWLVFCVDLPKNRHLFVFWAITKIDIPL